MGEFLPDDGTTNPFEAASETSSAESFPPLREAILAGRFIGAKNAQLAEDFADFLSSTDDESLMFWFGRDMARRLRVEPANLRAMLDRDLTALDTLISEQLDAILHDPKLLRLEGRWRGLAWLIDGVDQSARLKVKVLNVAWPEICRDLERAPEFDQSLLFRKIYEEEFGTPGGEPYGLLIIDHEVRHRPSAEARTDDVSALTLLSGIAAAAFAPTILGASPTLLEVDRFAELAGAGDILAPMRNADHARWRTLTTRPDMRFIGVALPRLQARAPWLDDGTRADGFRYAEFAPTAEQRVWMNAAYAFAAVVVRAFANYAWPADVRGVDVDRVGGGLVDQTPIEPFRTDPGHVWTRVPLEIVWNDKQERELLGAGLIPLSAVPNCEELVFGAVRSMQTPQRYSGPNSVVADANARLSAQINSILCASRFAHYLKMKGRQMVGAFRTSNEIQRDLQNWLLTYVNSNVSSSGENRARFPLVSAQVEVHEKPGSPGSFGCVVQLQPHYQLDDVAASFQLVADLGKR